MKFIWFMLLPVVSLFSQSSSIDQKLFEVYDSCKEETITHRRFKHQDLQPLLQKLKKNKLFQVKKLGKSIEGRDISMVSIGKGRTQVLLWSQMHGDEPTATMALFDMFNFFNQENDFLEFKTALMKELTIHFIPMLNPDGAEKYDRRNALNIDLNRDALRLQCPESQILKRVRDSLNADWGYNLHDQNRYYGAGLNPHMASVSFLAPAYNYEKSINEVRANSMKLIGVMNDILQKYIPNQIGRYSDDFEPRAFGDNIQKWGTSTILIESGGLQNDREKQRLRKLHFVMILSSFYAIATQSFFKQNIQAYEQIPFNKSNLFNDLVVRKANVINNAKDFVVDLAFRRNEVDYDQATKFYFRSSIRDVGDLSFVYGYEEFNASGYQTSLGKIYPKHVDDLKEINVNELLSQGFTRILVKKPPSSELIDLLPFSFSTRENLKVEDIQVGYNPSLIFEKNGKVEKVLVNGFLYDLEKDKMKIEKAWQVFVEGE